MAPSPRKPRGRTVASAAGQTLPLVVVFMFSILVFAGLVIDFGNAYRVQKALQASADASAAAGAGQLTRRRRRRSTARSRAGSTRSRASRPAT
jgi:Flp pilus assembly protein TadG